MRTNFKEHIFQPESQTDRSSLSEKLETAHLSDSAKRPSFLKKATAFLVIAVIFFFLGKTLYHNLGQLNTQSWSIKPFPLILSFLFLITNFAISAYVWERILLLFGAQLPFSQSFKIMSLSGLGKYLPGKIWLYLSQIYLSRKSNIPKSVCVFSLLLLFVVYNVAGLLIFTASLFLWGKFSPVLISFSILLCCTIFLIVFSPRIFNRMLKVLTFFTKRFKDGLIPEQLVFQGGINQTAQIILILMVDWIIFGVAVYFLVNSFYYTNLSQTIILCGIFAISSISGILSFFCSSWIGSQRRSFKLSVKHVYAHLRCHFDLFSHAPLDDHGGIFLFLHRIKD